MTQPHPRSPHRAAASFDFITMEDVRRIVERRLRWYGLAEIAVAEIGHDAAGIIAATLVDRKRNETYRQLFETGVTVPGSARMGRPSLAA